MTGFHHRHRRLMLATAALWAGLGADAATQGSAATDRAALEALYDATDGPGWTDGTSWKTAAPLGDWHGVTTDASGRVTELRLGDNGLTGSIPAALGSLARLGWLDLSSNELNGPIPGALRSLTNLFFLNLSRNQLSGSVPEWLGNMPRLLALYLLGNELTGAIPEELGTLDLRGLGLSWNHLSVGPIPAWLRSQTNLRWLYLSASDVTGDIPAWLGSLPDLEHLHLSYNWGLSGPLPSGLRRAGLERLDILVTQACAPAAWRGWLATFDFTGRLCGAATGVEIDVAVVYTPAAREAAGGVAAIEAEIDLLVAETNQAYETSRVDHRVTLVDASEVPYVESGDSTLDLSRLLDPSDGHMDEVHSLRDEVGADLVHLIVGETDDICGRAYRPGVFGLSLQGCGAFTFAHELGHNMGLRHDRHQVHHNQGGVRSHPAYGYVNQRALDAGAPESKRWFTIMGYPTQCRDAGVSCGRLAAFSSPRLQAGGDLLGVPYGSGGSGVNGPADAVAVLNATGPAVALWRERGTAVANRPPVAVGTLPPLTLGVDDGAASLDVAGAFRDPDGDTLNYRAESSDPAVARVAVLGSTLTVTPIAEGQATVDVTATDTDGANATQTFAVTVAPPPNRPPQPVGTLPPLTLGVDDGAASLDVGGAFRDPDGDTLNYRAESSDTAVATAAVLGSTLTVTPIAEGQATVDVTATDADGANATQTFAVTVAPPPNRPPQPVGTLPPLTLGVDDGAASLDVGGAFRDPDGDTLNYRAESSDTAVATAAVLGSTLTVTPIAEGQATVDVTATDADGANATQTFAVTVAPPPNRPPQPVGTLPPLTLGVDDGAASLDVGGAFRDPDGDTLNYRAESSDPAVATVAVLGSTVTVTPVAEGQATVDVTATDTDGANATQTFAVTVTPPPNRPPEPVGTLPPLTLGVDDGAARLDVAGAFRDPDGDDLTYRAASSDPAVATVAVLGSTVTVTPVAEGQATVDVTATDTDGANATQTFAVTVTPPPNRPPEPVGTLPPLTLGVDDGAASLDVAGAFRDPDGDDLTYRAASSDPAVATVAVLGSTVTVTPVAEGQATVDVTATDTDGANATQTFAVTVAPPPNRPPQPVGTLPPLTLGVDDGAARLDVAGAFRDPDGDTLTYRAASSDPAVATAAVLGSTLTVTPVAEGQATVDVTATDADGANATQTFAVTVAPPPNRPPQPVGTLPPLTLGVDDAAASLDVAGAFRDPDGDALTYRAVSSAPHVVAARAAGAQVTLTAAGAGTATVEVTATDPDGLSAAQSFRVRVTPPFTDDPIVPGETPVRAIHFTELRARIDVLRIEAGMARFRWTDPELRASVTPVRRVHLVELREALAAAYVAAGRTAPRWTDASPLAGTTPIRAAHVTELRAAVRTLE